MIYVFADLLRRLWYKTQKRLPPTVVGAVLVIGFGSCLLPRACAIPVGTRVSLVFLSAGLSERPVIQDAFRNLVAAHEAYRFDPIATEETPSDPAEGCIAAGRAKIRMRYMTEGDNRSAFSWVLERDHECRFTDLNHNLRGVTACTLAHEFFHQKNGDVCLDGSIFSVFPNTLWDIEYNALIAWRTHRWACL